VISCRTVISAISKTDLLVGDCSRDLWLPATVKSSRRDLRGGAGLAMGIVPCRQGLPEVPQYDESLSMWIVPVPYDGAFMEMFNTAWCLLQQFFAGEARVPPERVMPDPVCRRVADLLAGVRDAPTVGVIDQLSAAAPGLLERTETDIIASPVGDEPQPASTTDLQVLVAPVPLLLGQNSLSDVRPRPTRRC
jgi:hypothetical protein